MADLVTIGGGPRGDFGAGDNLDPPPPLQAWVEDWIHDALEKGYLTGQLDEATLQRVVWGAMLGGLDWMTNCGHLEVLQLQWSTIQHATEASASAWVYDTDVGRCSFEQGELDFWQMAQGKDGKSVLDERIDRLGLFELDPDERALGLGYVQSLLECILGDEIQRWKEPFTHVMKAAQVALWATLVWTISDKGWDWLLEANYTGQPRGIVPWGISCLPSPEHPAGFACTPARTNQRLLDPEDRTLLVFGRLLHPDQLLPRVKMSCPHCQDQQDVLPDGEWVRCRCGDSTARLDGFALEVDGPVEIVRVATCANEDCNVVTHCLRRVKIQHPGTGKPALIHLCDRCREQALRAGMLLDAGDHLPEEEGGTGPYRDYDCLRAGSVHRPYCKVTKTCKWNQLDSMARVLRETVENRTRARRKQIEDGTNPVIEYMGRTGLLPSPQ
mgnify:FL=1